MPCCNEKTICVDCREPPTNYLIYDRFELCKKFKLCRVYG